MKRQANHQDTRKHVPVLEVPRRRVAVAGYHHNQICPSRSVAEAFCCTLESAAHHFKHPP